ncbi:MAG: BrnT family toxin [Alphaproteobacteria bacterium]|nr:BrnT family toxin [Alphaproteobacteria bacterium]
MEITYDKNKDKANQKKHGLSFEHAYDFDFDDCVTVVDMRKDYGEVLYTSIGWYKDTLHTLCYTYRERNIRMISFRRAGGKERKRYAEEKTT